MNGIYIGKTFINYKDREKFDASNPDTWGIGGITCRKMAHSNRFKGCSIVHFKVVAVVTKESILEIHEHDGCFKNAEEYLLVLEKRLIESFMQMKATEMPKLLNNSTATGYRVGNLKEEMAGFVVYIVATTDRKFKVYSMNKIILYLDHIIIITSWTCANCTTATTIVWRTEGPSWAILGFVVGGFLEAL